MGKTIFNRAATKIKNNWKKKTRGATERLRNQPGSPFSPPVSPVPGHVEGGRVLRPVHGVQRGSQLCGALLGGDDVDPVLARKTSWDPLSWVSFCHL